MERKVRELKKGDVLCDMHDDFRGLKLDTPYVVKSHIRVRNDNPAEAVSTLVGEVYGKCHCCCKDHYEQIGNKHLVVLESKHRKIVGVYAYDGRYFGVVEIDLLLEPKGE